MTTINQLERRKLEIEHKIEEMKAIQTKDATCLVCGHCWKTKSKYIFVNCPSCRSPVKINEVTNNERNLAI